IERAGGRRVNQVLFLRNGRNRGGEDEDGEQASGSAHQRLSTGLSSIRGLRCIFRWSTSRSARMEPSVGKTSASTRSRTFTICPAGKILTTTGKLVNNGDTLLYIRAKTRDCRSCLLKAQCCPKVPLRRIPRNWSSRDSKRVEMLI